MINAVMRNTKRTNDDEPLKVTCGEFQVLMVPRSHTRGNIPAKARGSGTKERRRDNISALCLVRISNADIW